MNPQRDYLQDAASDPGTPGHPAIEVLVERRLLPGQIELLLRQAGGPTLELERPLPGRLLPGVLLAVPLDMPGQLGRLLPAGAQLEQLPEDLAPLVRGERRVGGRLRVCRPTRDRQAQQKRPHNCASFPPGSAPGRR